MNFNVYLVKMNEIKKYETITVIELKDWQVLTTLQSVSDVAKLLNSSDFIVIWETGFWKYEVKKFYKHSPDSVETYILTTQDMIVRERLNEIYKDRKEKKLNIAGVEHLLEIYQSRYGE